MNMKNGFTLSEVLITLGIIGVVTTMTLPSLIANYQKKVWLNQLKKTVATLEQGFQKMMADDGVDKLTDTTVWSYALNSTMGECYSDSYANDEMCTKFFNEWKKFFNIVEINLPQSEYKWNFLWNNDYDDMSGDYFIKFANGLWIDAYFLTNPHDANNFTYIQFDLNGQKRPNKYGRDIFVFALTNNGKLVSNGEPDDCLKKTNSGADCAARIIENGWEMDY